MITSPEVYPENDAITIVLDKKEPRFARILSAVRGAFGDTCTMLEDLDAHHCSLRLRRGGLREVRR